MKPLTMPSAIGASAPPLSVISSRPDWICRIEYPKPSVDEVQPVVTTWLGPRNPKRTLSSLDSDPMTPVGTQKRLICLYC